MSGGSYNYLTYKDAGELLSGSRDVELQEMADRLAKLGYANDAALETQELLLSLRACRNRIEASRIRLANLWKAIEWWDSGDSGEDSVKTALEYYRNPPSVQ